jgi:mitochondrial import receptor subunit TOM40
MATIPATPAPMPILEEKAPPASSSALSFLTDNAITSVINETFASLALKREAMGLTNPGTVESIDREVKREVLLSNYMFSGLRCDLQKIFSVNPLFRLQHGFAMGSQALPPWQMMAIYGTNRVSIVSTRLQSRS